jgi:hypothetical protein
MGREKTGKAEHEAVDYLDIPFGWLPQSVGRKARRNVRAQISSEAWRCSYLDGTATSPMGPGYVWPCSQPHALIGTWI